MSRSLTSLRRIRSPRTIITAVAVAIALVVVLPASAVAVAHAVAAPPANPTSADQIQNIDQVKTAIKAYYGDTLDLDRSTRSTARRRSTRSRRPAPTPRRWPASTTAPTKYLDKTASTGADEQATAPPARRRSCSTSTTRR